MEPPPQLSWYETVEGPSPLAQGDFLDNYPFPDIPIGLADLDPELQDAQLEGPIQVHGLDVVILTQSCDFQKLSDDDEVVLCPRKPYVDARQDRPDLSGDGWDRLRRGEFISLHLVSECRLPDHPFAYQVIDLKRVLTSPYGLAKRVAARHPYRVRLVSPYREHLGQAFARQFMRVGLPSDLPSRNPYR